MGRRIGILGALVVFLFGLVPAPADGAATTTGGVTYVSKNFVLERGQWKTFRAPCPRGTHVLGGGHYNPHGFAHVIGAHSYPFDGDDRDRRPDDGWAALLGGFVDRHQVTIHAQCADVLPLYETNTVTPGARERSPAGVGCPAGTEEISGGTRGHRLVHEISSGPTPIGPDPGWFAWVDNLDNEAHEVTVVVVCSQALSVTRVVAESTVADRSQAGVSANCPVGSILVGGGGGYNPFDPPALAMGTIAAMRPASATEWRAWVDNYDPSASEGFFAVSSCVAPLT